MQYVAKRRLKIGDKTREIGEVVPEAQSWSRAESWVRTGFLTEVEDPAPQPVRRQVHRNK